MPSRLRAVAALLAGVTLLAGCSSAKPIGSDSDGQGYVSGTGAITRVAVDEREAAPDFEGPLLGGGGDFRLADARGEVVVVNVWASWCAPCRKEAPELEQAWMGLRPKGVRFVGLNTRDDQPSAEAFVRRFAVTYPSVVDEAGERLLNFKSLPPNAVPTTLVFDRQGQIAARVLGEVSGATVRGLVEDELARPA